jgi:hypothetical protein
VIDHVIVGHRIAIGGDEEARADASHHATRLGRAVVVVAVVESELIVAVIEPELTEEPVERRTGLERTDVVVAVLVEARPLRGVHSHAHRNDGGFDLGDEVGKARGLLHGVGGLRRDRQRRQGRMLKRKWRTAPSPRPIR